MMFDTHGKFYLGRIFDLIKGKTSDQPLLYDPADLNTHAVVVGMTGSGKTGLCIDLLEEAALNGIPALMIDPKGDITNALLHFPDLAPGDFLPWINVDQARRDGKTPEQASAEVSGLWREEIARWEMGPERIRALKNAAQYAVYTPGSDAGIPVSILASLKAPPIPWEGNREVLIEKISETVTALLSLVGLQDVDPVRSREHILLANIFENAWKQGKNLDLGELILQTQTPPFAKLGVFDVNTFFPEAERFELAMRLNNILAAPSFQVWIEGQPLDIPGLLYAEDGRPRHSVFYIAHLTDAERMFFVTLLYSAVETWMRSQPGSNSLKAIVYFDEIYGYLPPVGNPPSKQPVLRMLKTARAFGVGLVLVTQNPVDLDYKALANAGTWFIGKLQTEQDKQRLLDGLQGATAGALDRSVYDRLISSLGKRVFLLHNVHQAPAAGEKSDALLFQTRWAMNFLAGPLTRTQVPTLNRLAGVGIPLAEPTSEAASSPKSVESANLDEYQAIPLPGSPPPAPPSELAISGSSFDSSTTTRPTLPGGVVEYVLPNNLTFTGAFEAAAKPFPAEAFSLGILYRPVLLAQASIRFLNRKYNLDSLVSKTALVTNPDRRGMVHWDHFLFPPVDLSVVDSATDPRARFVALEAPYTEARVMAALEKDFADWAYRSAQSSVRANEALKLYAGPETSPAEFRTLCAEASRKRRDEEVLKVAASYDKRIETLTARLGREERELSEDQVEYSQRKIEEMGTHAENVLSLFSRRSATRRLSTSLTKRRLTEQARAEVEESQEAIKDIEEQVKALEGEKERALQEVNDRWGDIANQVSEVSVTPSKKDVVVDLFGVAWFPYQVARVGDEVIELPGYR
jgi:hypothetical protein